MSYTAINIQGNILSSEILEKIRHEDIRFQSAKDFGLGPKTTVREEINDAWRLALSHWGVFKQKQATLSDTDTGTTETRNYWMKPLLNILGYELTQANAELINGKSYAISFRAANLDSFPIHIVGVNQSLDKRPDHGVPRLSPHALAQEYLNHQEHMYALVSNGKFLRLIRDATKLSRLSYLEWNLEQIMEDSLFSEFALIYRVLHASRLPQKMDAGPESILEFYHQEAIASGSRIRERLSSAVEISIKELANGFLNHESNDSLRKQIAENRLTANEYYIQNLRIIYRLLFLMVIEERQLIFPSLRSKEQDQLRDTYFSYYSLRRLCQLTEQTIYVDPKKTDLWLSLKTCFTLFENGQYGKKLGIEPLGSGLFDADAIGMMRNLNLSNGTVLKVIRNLISFENENHQRVRVNYADLDVEEFGSVYEGLLEYEPVFTEPTSQPSFIFKAGNERSKSGSHYTPEELVKPLIKHSLDYLIEDKLKEPNPETALLSLRVCDVACGSGHILLSAARRIGFELGKVRSGEEQPSPSVQRHAIRDVINHCIYGVDKNPLAVELCKVAMWLEAHNPGEPLNFLDHHIKCGDAIVGLAHRNELENGISNEAFKELPGDDKAVAKAYRDRNTKERKIAEERNLQLQLHFQVSTENIIHEAMEEYKTFNRLPESTPEEIERKAKAYRRFLDSKGYGFLKIMADLQVAQFFIPKTHANKDYLLTESDYRGILTGYKGWQIPQSAKASAIAFERRFFHWFLEFPEVLNSGGFDSVLGNPPFLGGLRISTNYGVEYLNYINSNYKGSSGTCDIVAYFFRRTYEILGLKGILSLISTNTISQGDTREGGLVTIINNGGVINFALKSINWPGVAAVKVSLVSISKEGIYDRHRYLGSEKVKNISSFLSSDVEEIKPHELNNNSGLSFAGTYVLGLGFVLSPLEKKEIIDKDPNSANVIFPYFNGEDVNSIFDNSIRRYVINFFDWDEERAKKYKLCYDRILERVKPERDALKAENSTSKKRKHYWWLYGGDAKNLYLKIKDKQRVLISCRVSKYVNHKFIEVGGIYDIATSIVARSEYWEYCFLQNTFHDAWAWKYASTMKSDIRYTSRDCIDTFPILENISNEKKERLDNIGEFYHEHRRQLMLGMKLGLTKTYNLFHSNAIAAQTMNEKDKQVAYLQKHLENTPITISFNEAIQGIIKLRELHVQMDETVLDAYGWNDIKLKHDFYEVDYLPENDRIRYTIHPEARKEVLKRLLELNHKIHAEEVEKGLWEKKGAKKKIL